MKLPPGGCKLTGNGVHQWILIDTVTRIDMTNRLYLFACRFCLVSLPRTSESLEIVEEPAERVASAG
jgi:hypothetical protein